MKAPRPSSVLDNESIPAVQALLERLRQYSILSLQQIVDKALRQSMFVWRVHCSSASQYVQQNTVDRLLGDMHEYEFVFLV